MAPSTMNHNVPLSFMVVVTNRGKGEELSGFLQQYGITFNLLTLGRGTADKKLLLYLGLGETEKDIMYSTLPRKLTPAVLNRLSVEWNLNKANRGIAFSIPIFGVGDVPSYKRLRGATQEQEGTLMEQSYQYDVIIAVMNQGYADEVMDVARAAGAPGGTVLHARGLGLKQAEKFFGISIQPEKDMLFIVAQKGFSKPIMAAIVEKKGFHHEAKTIAFSMPANGVAGLPLVDPREQGTN